MGTTMLIIWVLLSCGNWNGSRLDCVSLGVTFSSQEACEQALNVWAANTGILVCAPEAKQ